MSDAHGYVPPPPPPPAEPPTNGIGIAGFVLSLAAIPTCGLLSPVALIVSAFGLRKEPRGLAIAGTVIGALGSLWLVLAGFALVMLFLGVKEAVEKGGGSIETVFVLGEAQKAIELERSEKGRLPDEPQGNDLIAELRDGWDRALRYELHGDSFTVRSAGSDGVFGTVDDASLEGH
jgi:hypothetical protein